MIELDRYLFFLINGTLTHPWLDDLMPIITNAKLWLPILIVAFLWLLLAKSGKWRPMAICIFVAVCLADLTSSRLIKPMVSRTRPCNIETNARLLIKRTKSKSFPSSHAANAAAAAGVIFGEAGLAAGLPALLIAFAVGYSRIYVGVHYPFDVIAGFCLGLAMAWIVLFIRRRWWPKSKIHSDNDKHFKNNENQPGLHSLKAIPQAVSEPKESSRESLKVDCQQ